MLGTYRFPFALFVAGILVGAVSVEISHRALDLKKRERFEQRLSCKALADSYARQNSDDRRTASSELVDYSPARDTCIGAVTIYGFGDLQTYEVVDLISGKSIHSKWCYGGKCGNGTNIRLMEERDAAFYQALTRDERSH
jgi:hypothetical protein